MDPLIATSRIRSGRRLARHLFPRGPGPAPRRLGTRGRGRAGRFLVAWTPPEDLLGRCRDSRPFLHRRRHRHSPVAALPPAVTVVRMVDPDLTASMVEYVTMAVLALHRDLPFYRTEQAAGRWTPGPCGRRRCAGSASWARRPRPGRGAGGGGFRLPVRGWSATPKDLRDRDLRGDAALGDFLAGTDNPGLPFAAYVGDARSLDRRLFDRLPDGASLVNAGRGGTSSRPTSSLRSTAAGSAVRSSTSSRRSGTCRSSAPLASRGDGDPACRERHPAGRRRRQVIQGVRAHLRASRSPMRSIADRATSPRPEAPHGVGHVGGAVDPFRPSSPRRSPRPRVDRGAGYP